MARARCTFSGPIPADAGEPQGCDDSVCAVRAYPRGRGGAGRTSRPEAAFPGLSPRTRGSPQDPSPYRVPRGPIPADAGEPCAWRAAGCAPRAYPRGRGGARRADETNFRILGLSPRTRGSRVCASAGCRSPGPIPADAGEPGRSDPPHDAGKAYPRGRGGALSASWLSPRAAGLSPRTRGSQQVGQRVGLLLGPIPADAGEPSAPRSTRSRMRAYPRGRGGAVEVTRASNALQGLSPRTRGSR